MSHRTITLEEAKHQARALGLADGDDEADDEDNEDEAEPVEMDNYQIQAAQFVNRMGIDDQDAQFKALVEEVGELAEALNRDEDPAAEIADVLVTAFGLADVVDVDVRAAYDEKMAHNLQKSGRKVGGKVVDDVDDEDIEADGGMVNRSLDDSVVDEEEYASTELDKALVKRLSAGLMVCGIAAIPYYYVSLAVGISIPIAFACYGFIAFGVTMLAAIYGTDDEEKEEELTQ